MTFWSYDDKSKLTESLTVKLEGRERAFMVKSSSSTKKSAKLEHCSTNKSLKHPNESSAEEKCFATKLRI